MDHGVVGTVYTRNEILMVADCQGTSYQESIDLESGSPLHRTLLLWVLQILARAGSSSSAYVDPLQIHGPSDGV